MFRYVMTTRVQVQRGWLGKSCGIAQKGRSTSPAPRKLVWAKCRSEARERKCGFLATISKRQITGTGSDARPWEMSSSKGGHRRRGGAALRIHRNGLCCPKKAVGVTNVTAPERLKNCRVGTKRLETIAAELKLDSAKLPARALRRDLGVARSDRIPSSVTRPLNARGECRPDNRGK